MFHIFFKLSFDRDFIFFASYYAIYIFFSFIHAAAPSCQPDSKKRKKKKYWRPDFQFFGTLVGIHEICNSSNFQHFYDIRISHQVPVVVTANCWENGTEKSYTELN